MKNQMTDIHVETKYVVSITIPADTLEVEDRIVGAYTKKFKEFDGAIRQFEPAITIDLVTWNKDEVADLRRRGLELAEKIVMEQEEGID